MRKSTERRRKMADKLLPCPLCGGEATLVEDIYNDQLYYYVICSNDDCNANTGRCNTEDEAITKWNRRVSEAEEKEK